MNIKSTLISLVVSCFISLSAVADPIEFEMNPLNRSSRNGSEVIQIFLQKLPELTVANEGLKESREFPALEVFSKALAEVAQISANCAYRGRSAIEDCTLIVSEGDMSEVYERKAHVFSFSLVRGKLMNTTIEYFVGL